MKILHNISLIKTSSTEPLAPKSGVIYSSGSSVFLTDKSGAVFDLTANRGSTLVYEYTASGGVTTTYTWTKNPSINYNIKYLQVVCVGAGAGGGGGQSSAINTLRNGGGGGGGGSIAIAWFESSSLTTSSYTIQVGGGGAGGAGGNSSIGSEGTAGDNSFFRSGSSTILVQGSGGLAGAPYNIGGEFQSSFIPNLFYQLVGSRGGNGNTSPIFNNATPLYSFNGSIGTGGGGGGGNITSINAAQNGATGSAVFKNGQLVFTGSAGTANGGNGQNGVNNFINGLILAGFSSSLYSSSFGVGTPGHGGAASDSISTNGGNGGSGSIGCGGGGGGAVTSGGVARAGNGGRGGDGYVLLIAYY